MKSMRSLPHLLAAVALVVAACDVDDYDTGDSRYSYLRADFGMLHTSASQQVDYLLNDDGDRISFASPATVSWASRADTLYRALTYYDTNALTVFSTSQVPVIRAALRDTLQQIDLDPLTVESVWKGGGFLNVGYAVKSGVVDSIDARQTIGLVHDSLTTDSDGNKTLRLTIRHAQNGVPEYYSVRGYFSMNIPDSLADATIQVSAYTYDGWQTLSR